MNATLTTNSPARQRGRRLVSLLVAVLVASFAFGVGLPWIVADAPPGTEELWAREVQSAPATQPSKLPVRAEARRAVR